MTLSALHWKRIAGVVPASSSIADLLAAINTALTAVTYYDGSARTPGSGSAWSVIGTEGTPLEAVRVRPPYTSSIGQGVTLCGKSVAPPSGPTFAAPSTGWANNCLYLGQSKGTIGAIANWYSANPWTTDTFFGLWRVLISTTWVVSRVNVYESEEAFYVVLEHSGGQTWFGAGAWVDPLVTGAASAESDGRLYGQWSTNTTTAVPSTFLYDAGNAGAPFTYRGMSTQSYTGVFTPGAGTIRTLYRGLRTDVTDDDFFVTEDADPVTWPIDVHNASSRRFSGVLREIRHTRRAALFQMLRQGAPPVDKGHIVSQVTVGVADALVLMV